MELFEEERRSRISILDLQNIPADIYPQGTCSVQLINESDYDDVGQELRTNQMQKREKPNNIRINSNLKIEDLMNMTSLSQMKIALSSQEIHRQLTVTTLQKIGKSQYEKDILKKIVCSLPVFREKGDYNGISNEIVENLELISLPKNSTIFSYGDVGDGYYTILEGYCFLILPKKKGKEYLEQQGKSNENELEDEQLKKSYRKLVQSDSISNLDYQRQSILKQYPNMVVLKKIEVGSSFGEISLLTGKRRTGTVVCGSECKLMKLKKEDFEQLINNSEQQQIEERVEFLSQISFLQKVPRIKIITLLQESQILHLQRGHNIYRQGDKAETVYFIEKGIIQIFKKISKQPQQDKNLNQGDTTTRNSERIYTVEESVRQLRRCNTLNKYEQKKYSIASSEMQPLVILDEGQYFGDDQIFSNDKIRDTMAQVTSPEAIIIGIKIDLLLFIIKEYNSLEILFKECDLKQKFKYKRQELIECQSFKQTQKKIRFQSQQIMLQQHQLQMQLNKEMQKYIPPYKNFHDQVPHLKLDIQSQINSQKRITSPIITPKSCKIYQLNSNQTLESQPNQITQFSSLVQSPNSNKNKTSQNYSINFNKYSAQDLEQNSEYFSRSTPENQQIIPTNVAKSSFKINQSASKAQSTEHLSPRAKRFSEHVNKSNALLYNSNFINTNQFSNQTSSTLPTLSSSSNINLQFNNHHQRVNSSTFQSGEKVIQEEKQNHSSSKRNIPISSVDFDPMKEQYKQYSSLSQVKKMKLENLKRKEHFKKLLDINSPKQNLEILKEMNQKQVTQFNTPQHSPNKEKSKGHSKYQIKPKLDLLNQLYNRGAETERMVNKYKRVSQSERSSLDFKSPGFRLKNNKLLSKVTTEESLQTQLSKKLNKLIHNNDLQAEDNTTTIISIMPSLIIEGQISKEMFNKNKNKSIQINQSEIDKLTTLNLTNQTTTSLNKQNLHNKSKENAINFHTLNLPSAFFQQKPYVRMKKFSLHHNNKFPEYQI